jgi:hypothetical protein
MARKIRLWKRIFWGAFISLFSSIVAFMGNGLCRRPANSLEPVKKLSAYDFHWLKVENDSDADFLSDDEEIALRTDPGEPDMNDNARQDGLEIGSKYSDRIMALPLWHEGDPIPNEIYRIDHPVWGYETCEICGRSVNMGYTSIINPLTSMEIDIDFIALHYLEHNSFSYEGNIHEGRIDVDLLARVFEDGHLFPVQNDADKDLLADAEEEGLGSDPADHDENVNWEIDGVDLAFILRERIENLPEGPLPDETYKIYHWVYGEEQCEICGELINMGYIEITDPVRSMTIEFPIIGVHYMAHGGFSFAGDINEGRVDVVRLTDILGIER